MILEQQRKRGLPFRTVWFATTPNLTLLPTIFMQCAVKQESRWHVRKEFPTLHSNLLLMREELWRNCNGTTRNEVQRAIRDDVETQRVGVEEFLERCARPSARAGLHSGVDVDQLMRFGDAARCLIAVQGAEVHCGAVVMQDSTSGRARLLHSIRGCTSASPTVTSRSNRLLLWSALIAAKDEGFRVFDWGGAHYGENQKLLAITRFKRGFGGEQALEFNYLPRPWFR